MAEKGGARRKVLCDTNIIVRILTADQPTLARAAARWLDEAPPKSVVLTDIVIAETAYVLTSVYRVSLSDASSLVADLIRLPCFDVSDHAIWFDALTLWGAGRLDLADAHLAAVARRTLDCDVLSFDKDFDKVDEVERIDPRSREGSG